MLNHLNYIKKSITTFFYLGYLPLIPGTYGSIAGLFIYLFLRQNLFILVSLHSIIALLGFLFAGDVAARLFKRRDPRQIVIDEINGMLVSFIGLPTSVSISIAGITTDKFILIAGFVIFRILDALKPYPANLLHKLHGSLGIMGDDIVAGVYTNLILRLIIYF